jgi:hypothetical protein
VVREGVGAGGEMTQALYAYMNNKNKFSLKKKKKKRKLCSGGRRSSVVAHLLSMREALVANE